MSCLLLTTASGNLQNEAIKASSHEEGIGGKSSGLLERGSCRSRSGHPCCMVLGDSREGFNSKQSGSSSVDVDLDIWKLESQEVQTATCMCRNSHRQFSTDSEIGIAVTKLGCSDGEQQQVRETYTVDEVVCKLVSQLKLYPKTSISSSQKGQYQKVDSHEIASLRDNKPASGLAAKPPEIAKTAHVEGSSGILPLPIQVPEEGNVKKVKSALRGSHEKSSGGSRRQMHVTWAPDVYDPPCTSASHTVSQHRRRHPHHHYPKGEHKSRHKGKGHTDSQRKSQKKLMRRLKHPSEIFSGDSSLLLQRGQESRAVLLKENISPSLDGLTLDGPRVRPFISLQKACFLSPVLSINECELVALDKIQGCQQTLVQTPKLLV